MVSVWSCCTVLPFQTGFTGRVSLHVLREAALGVLHPAVSSLYGYSDFRLAWVCDEWPMLAQRFVASLRTRGPAVCLGLLADGLATYGVGNSSCDKLQKLVHTPCRGLSNIEKKTETVKASVYSFILILSTAVLFLVLPEFRRVSSVGLVQR